MPRHPLLQRNLVIITLLSLIAIAQTAWWVIFQVQEGRRLHDEQAHIWRQQIAVVEAIMEAHPDSADTYLEPVAKHFTDLKVDPELGSVVVRQEAREALNDLAYGRIRMFASEGAFFILLIVAGIAYVYWTAAREAQSERLQLNFLHAVSHELRTPVSSLNLSLETFEMRELQPAQKAELLERMRQDLDRLNGQIDYLLRAQSLVRGELHLRPVDQDLTRLTREAVEFYRPLFEQKGIELTTDIEHDVHLKTDGPHYVIMVRNLIDNAFKHADAERVGVRLRSEDKGVRLEVADDGRGIPHNLHRRIFQRFFRPGSEDRRTTHGAGLGLYLVQQFAQTLGGRSYVSSEGHGRGSTFVIELPRS
jgi:signal transduction histidine kinase